MALDRLGEYPSAWAAAQVLGPRLGVGAETLCRWILQAQITPGRSGPTSEELEEIRRLRAEVRDLKEANEILKAASSAPAFSFVKSDAVADNLGVAAEGPYRHTRRESLRARFPIKARTSGNARHGLGCFP
jgi:hypothetical protein